MDPNQWRNPAYNCFGPGLPRLDIPFLSTEQPGLSVGTLSPHLAGSRPAFGLTGTLAQFSGENYFKPGSSPFVSEAQNLRGTEHYGLELSPTKPVFSQERTLEISDEKLQDFGHSSNLFGRLPTDLSPLSSHHSLPPPAHCGISSVHSSPQQISYHSPPGISISKSPFVPTSNYISPVLDKADQFFNQNFQRLDQSYSRDHLSKLQPSEPQFRYQPRSSQPYIESLKRDSEYDPVSPAPAISEAQVDNLRSTAQPYRNPEHFSFRGGNSFHEQNISHSNSVPTSNPQTNHYSVHSTTQSQSAQGLTIIQAVADSTTKPKRSRGRKKKEISLTEEERDFQDKKLVNSFVQQEQQLEFLSQNKDQENQISQNPTLSVGHMYSHSYNNSNQNVNSFNMQSPQISSSKHRDEHQIPISQNIPRNNYPVKQPICGNYNDSLIESPYRNSPENYSPQGNNMSRNNFMCHGFNDRNISLSNQGEERLIDNNQYSYNTPSNQPSFVEQLSSGNDFDGLNSMELDSGVYGNTNLYNMDTFNSNNPDIMQQQSSTFSGMAKNTTTTIDEAALSSLISDNPQTNRHIPQERLFQDVTNDVDDRPYIAEPALPSTAVVNPIDDDDEFQHLKSPPVIDKKPVQQALVIEKPVIQPTPVPQAPVQVKVDPPPTQKPPEKVLPTKSNKNNAFMDSFLSFIQGKKPETLSSVNNMVVKKPELPKYIPEPKRPRQPSVEKSSDSAASTPKPDTDTKSDINSQSNDDTTSSRMTISDEELPSQVTGTVKSIEGGTEQHPSLKMRIKLQKTITPSHNKHQTKISKPTSRLKRSRTYEDSDGDQVRSSGEEYHVTSSQEEEERDKTPSPLAPTRRLSTRKAKEKVLQKKYKESDSEIEDDNDVPETYDSDSDPAWTPFAEEKKEPSFDNFGPQRKGRTRNTKSKLKPKNIIKSSKPTPSKARKVESQQMAYQIVPSPEPESSEDTEEEDQAPPQALVMGSFVINKKDVNNFEGFPIWRIEAGKMMRKFELFVDKGEIFHRSLSTYSSWLPNMEKNYIPVRTKIVPHRWTTTKDSQSIIVQVNEEDRPKPKLDSSKETEYEKDPLADMFNVFLQVFLSQAMEPTFLDAIHESGDDFYLKPLKMIDNIISKKLIEISSKVRWKDDFKKAAELRPHIREVDRPNLKTLCQATQNATQNAIKSVHMFGQPYDRTTLQEIPDNSSTQGSVEYLVGKLASSYIGPYHSLHHFKYNLYKRCLAKVDIVREGNTELDNAEILDKCLNNRTWVLKIFDDLKNMLEKG